MDETIELKVLVIVPHYWGAGATIADAWKNVTAESGKSMREHKRTAYQIYAVDKTAHCEGIHGNIVHDRRVKPVKIESKGD